MVGKIYAQGGPNLNPPTIQVPTPVYGFQGNFGNLLATLITWVIVLGAVITLVFILIGGFKYMTAGDDADQAEGARKTITNGVIGLIIIASAFILWRLIIVLLNLQSFFGG